MSIEENFPWSQVSYARELDHQTIPIRVVKLSPMRSIAAFIDSSSAAERARLSAIASRRGGNLGNLQALAKTCDAPAGGVAEATDVRTTVPDGRRLTGVALARCFFFAGCGLAETSACRFFLDLEAEAERRGLGLSGSDGGGGGGGGGAEAARVVTFFYSGYSCGCGVAKSCFSSGCAATRGFLGSTGSGSIEAARLVPGVGASSASS
ncbi:hypothetical protein T492DRAFT_844925 [Pavlovales sp. CCMP2436]|nr:hypothetical protein T492DRAFT_844925 [Pavlovales sp. CCMP2436]